MCIIMPVKILIKNKITVKLQKGKKTNGLILYNFNNDIF